ncbi:BFR protein [Gonium pectorale]|uniref:B-related factor 1 n=1 Tax=Gonium pectorale TaxID=33097 RepID=A0A150GED6_GONPE|nr:BFR protein [Gonium pectorale]|eukprot:KXZ48221.1 BFR protein [Gonium pectorale]
MVWCATCAAEVEVEVDDANGFSCCVQCGRVVEDTAFSSDVMFSKGADGEGELVGKMVGASGEARGIGRFSGGRMWANGGDSHEAAVTRGRYEIMALVEALRISPSSEATEAAHRLYKLALQRGFTRGRRANQVAAVCLYIFCRLEKRPYMLIDFSDQLSVNIFTLGGVFLQMLRLLRLDENATFTKPIDPSLYMNRFVDRLRLPTQELKTKITNTAMRLVQSMKRDWMLVGRRPSGICGAALFLASHIHGVEKTKKDVISIVHIGWSTVERRVMELAETRDAELTLGQLGERDKAIEAEQEQIVLNYERAAAENPPPPLPAPAAATAPIEGAAGEGADGAAGGSGDGAGADTVVAVDPNAEGQRCEHVRAGALLLAHGLCRGCLEEYLKITMSGPQGGAYDPPAYLRNLRRELKQAVRAKLSADEQGLLREDEELLALEGPPGTSGADDAAMGVHERRHMENERALEEEEEEEDGAGPSGSGARRAGSGRVAPEEEADFDEALRRSELQSLTKAVGGAVAAAVAEPPRRRSPTAAPPGGRGNRGAAAAAGTGAYGSASDWEAGPAAGRAAAASRAGARVDIEEEEEEEEEEGEEDHEGEGGRAKRSRTAGDAEAGDAAAAGGERPVAAATAAAAGDDDNLSDVDDDAIAGYLASTEEASVREMLWTEMNKDWIEKQEAKKAAEAAAEGAPSGRTKRKYTRKPKLPAAEDAAGATRNLLESKKLSNKINYGALENLFGGGASGSGAGPSTSDMGGAGGYGAYGDAGAGVTPLALGGGPAAGDDDGGEPAPAVAAAMAKRAEARKRDAAAESARYAASLEEETRRRSGGLGGGFLGSLTFVRSGEASVPGARARPAGLSLRGRGR